MRPLIVALPVACLALTACETMQQRVANKEDLLTAAGFAVKPANTPEREAQLKQLPANKFVPKPKGDTVEYVYADPIVCNCLYIGDQKAFGAYKQEVFQQHIADEQQMTAMTYQDNWNWNGWDWGPWGPGWGY